MKNETLFDLKYLNYSPITPQITFCLTEDEPAQPDCGPVAVADDRSFFDVMLDVYEEDPERWDGLE